MRRVRESLAGMGIRGFNSNPTDCAVARFLRRRFGRPFHVGFEVHWSDGSCDTPPPCAAFFKEFDCLRNCSIRWSRCRSRPT